MEQQLQGLWSMAQSMLAQYGWNILIALIIFFLGRWVCRWVSKVLAAGLRTKGVDELLVSFLKGLVYYILLAAVIIAALGQLGINTTSFLAILGTLGLAIGLALKDNLANFSSGVLLILFRPFGVGDYISVAGASGTVQAININNTILHTPDNQKVFIPNSSVMGDVITNVTANDTRRVDLVVGIGYEDDIPKAKQLLQELVAAEDLVLKDPAPTIAVIEMADSSVNFVVRPWAATGDYWTVYFSLTEKIKIALDENGISIPYPQRDIHIISQPS